MPSSKIPFAREGVPPAVGVALMMGLGWFLHPLIAVGLAPCLLFILWFYRDPERQASPVGEGKERLVSPADGKVMDITPAEHPFTGRCQKVGIFMSPLNVHVNRSPCPGRAAFLDYRPGRKLVAFHPKASEENERFYLGLDTSCGPVMMVQIAGALARRIVCRAKRGQEFSEGERYGMIQFGSKVDLYFPEGMECLVSPGEEVRAGETVIGVRS